MRLAASVNTEVDLLSLFAVPLLSTTTKYIATNYKVDIVKLGPHLKKALKAGVEKKRPLLESIVLPCHQKLRSATNSTVKDTGLSHQPHGHCETPSNVVAITFILHL